MVLLQGQKGWVVYPACEGTQSRYWGKMEANLLSPGGSMISILILPASKSVDGWMDGWVEG